MDWRTTQSRLPGDMTGDLAGPKFHFGLTASSTGGLEDGLTAGLTGGWAKGFFSMDTLDRQSEIIVILIVSVHLEFPIPYSTHIVASWMHHCTSTTPFIFRASAISIEIWRVCPDRRGHTIEGRHDNSSVVIASRMVKLCLIPFLDQLFAFCAALGAQGPQRNSSNHKLRTIANYTCSSAEPWNRDDEGLLPRRPDQQHFPSSSVVLGPVVIL